VLYKYTSNTDIVGSISNSIVVARLTSTTIKPEANADPKFTPKVSPILQPGHPNCLEKSTDTKIVPAIKIATQRRAIMVGLSF
jgi:hypothetical protein